MTGLIGAGRQILKTGFSSGAGTIAPAGGYTGMSILIVIVVALVLLGLALYAVQRSPIPSPINWLLQLVLIVIAIWFIGTRAGFF
jgi:hypothetical protein